MVIIRLSRGGSKKRPYFNVVVADSKKRRDGRFIERVGFYNPMARDGAEALKLNLERITYWQSHGALLSETMSRIVKLNAKGPEGLAAMKKKDLEKTEAKKAKKASEKAAEVAARLEVGTSWVNQHLAITPVTPFGGRKWSGIGRENGKWGLSAFLEPFTLNIKKKSSVRALSTVVVEAY